MEEEHGFHKVAEDQVSEGTGQAEHALRIYTDVHNRFQTS